MTNASSIKLLALLPVLCLLPALGGAPRVAQAAPPTLAAASAAAADSNNARVIVKYRAGSALAQRSPVAGMAQALGVVAVRPQHAALWSGRLGLPLTDGRVLGERTQALRGQGIGSAALAQRLAAQPDVEWAVVDQRRTIAAAAVNTPNDPLYPGGLSTATPTVGQWYLRGNDSTVKSAINAIGAWATTTGSASVTVAVLDTGVRFDHPDLAGKLWPGYDFVADAATAVDGGGRDNDASDPGDWSTASDSCGASNSSWHGTQVAGLIGAASDSAIGMAGVGRNVMVLPVRVLGKCGGYDSDIVAGLNWAIGASNAAGCTATSTRSETCNPHPAQVVNMSLGSSGTCSANSNQLYFDAINAAVARGVSVVVAAGNQVGKAVNVPANCPGALAVAAVRHVGTKVGFSSIGPEVAISAPGGNCVNDTSKNPGLPCLYPLISTTNTGTSSPAAASYSTSFSYEVGTSFSAPLVAGTAALMLSVDPTLSPAAIKAALQATARSFPSTGALTTTAAACQAPGTAEQDECYCSTSTCGAGLLDAGAAVARIDGLRVALAASRRSVNPGEHATLSNSGTAVRSDRSIASYRWSLVGSPSTGAALPVDVTTPSIDASFTQPGRYFFTLAVTDTAGIASQATTAVTVANAPTAAITLAGTLAAGRSQTATGAASSGDAASGRSIASYAWAISSNTASASISGATDAATVSLAASSVGSFVLSLTVTDTGGLTATTVQTVTVAAAPVAAAATGGSGGGALGWGWLAGLGLAVWALARRPAQG